MKKENDFVNEMLEPEIRDNEVAFEEAAADKPKKKAKKGVVAIIIAAVAVVIIAALALLLPFGVLSTPLTRGGMVMKIGEYKVMADEYIFSTLPMKEYLETNNPDYFSREGSEKTLFDYYEQGFVEEYAFYNWAIEEGFALTDEEAASIQTTIDDIKANYESEDAFKEAIAANYFTEDLLTRYYQVQTIMSKFQQYLYSESDYSKPTDAEIAAFVDEHGIVHYNEIFLALTGDEQADALKKELAMSIANELAADPTRFEELSALYNETTLTTDLIIDGQSVNYGSYMSSQDAENICALKIGEVSDVIEYNDGYSIVLRSEIEDSDDVVSYVVTDKINNAISERTANTPIKYGFGYKRMKLDQLVFNAEQK